MDENKKFAKIIRDLQKILAGSWEYERWSNKLKITIDGTLCIVRVPSHYHFREDWISQIFWKEKGEEDKPWHHVEVKSKSPTSALKAALQARKKYVPPKTRKNSEEKS